MGILMQGGVFSLVHAVVLLAVSFFVLLAAHKSDSVNLKTFGFVIAVLLWVAAALVLGKGVSARHPMFHRTHMMGEKMERPMGGAEAPQQANQGLPAK